MFSNWLRRKSSNPRPRLSASDSKAMLASLRKALQNSATPVGAPPTPQPDAAFMLTSCARSTEIVGHMLDTMSNRYSFMKKPAAFFVTMGRICWSVVEAAMPRSIPNLLMRYWFQLLLIVEIVMIVGGTLITSEKSIQPLGVKLLILTLVFRALIEMVRLKIGHMRAPRTVVAVVLLVVFVTLWRGVVHVQDDDIPAIKNKFLGEKQSYVCRWLGCEGTKAPAKQPTP
jgi:hypothetical protein